MLVGQMWCICVRTYLMGLGHTCANPPPTPLESLCGSKLGCRVKPTTTEDGLTYIKQWTYAGTLTGLFAQTKINYWGLLLLTLD
jgi:hypothetical protein